MISYLKFLVSAVKQKFLEVWYTKQNVVVYFNEKSSILINVLKEIIYFSDFSKE